MPAPELPPRPSTAPPRSNWIGLLLALAAGLVIFVVLAALTGGLLALVVVVGGGVFALAALHYVVWGWWLSKMLYDEEAADSAGQKTDGPLRDDQRLGDQRLERQQDISRHHGDRIDRDPHS